MEGSDLCSEPSFFTEIRMSQRAELRTAAQFLPGCLYLSQVPLEKTRMPGVTVYFWYSLRNSQKFLIIIPLKNNCKIG